MSQIAASQSELGLLHDSISFVRSKSQADITDAMITAETATLNALKSRLTALSLEIYGIAEEHFSAYQQHCEAAKSAWNENKNYQQQIASLPKGSRIQYEYYRELKDKAFEQWTYHTDSATAHLQKYTALSEVCLSINKIEPAPKQIEADEPFADHLPLFLDSPVATDSIAPEFIEAAFSMAGELLSGVLESEEGASVAFVDGEVGEEFEGKFEAALVKSGLIQAGSHPFIFAQKADRFEIRVRA